MSGKKSKNRNKNINTRSGLSAYLRRPAVQFGIVAFVVLVIFLIAQIGGGSAGTGLAAEVNADTAYQMAQDEGVFVLDVREQVEWDEYHAPMATLIPLGELQARLSEVPKDKQILVVCRSGNRSQEGRDILLTAGYNATSMSGGMKDWSAKGYPVDGTPPQ